MKTHEFSIVASGLDPSANDFEQRFYDAGCDDATVSFQKGHIIVDFAREADTPEEAINTAVDDVLKAGATVDRIEPDPLVTLADIAERAGISRAAVTNYAQGKREPGFPSPVARVTSGSPLWTWVEVVEWMVANQKISQYSLREAQAIKRANERVKTCREYQTA